MMRKGKSTTAIYAGWTIPNIEGWFAYDGTEGGGWDNKLFSYTSWGGNRPAYDHSWSNNGHPGTRLNLSGMDVYANHTSTTSFWPNHYRCKWYIKHR